MSVSSGSGSTWHGLGSYCLDTRECHSARRTHHEASPQLKQEGC